ncbi:hypothetical protein [Streptomyces sp. PR69]|uniref:hypothetical protein n=1 Tax=Streptomyces sp. PR69 TaxID=2984950 RepID=UPI0022647199|nr:hypothetical protein [Streptomyces sp. PR69]
MVDAPKGETLREIAARYNRAYDTLRTRWARHPAWPDSIGWRGRAKVYDSAEVDKVIAEHIAPAPVELDPNRLYTAREIANLVGISPGTIRAEVSKGRWPAPDAPEGVANRWYGSTAAEALKNRGGYHRRTG